MAVADIVRSPLIGYSKGHYSDITDTFVMLDEASAQTSDDIHRHQPIKMGSQDLLFKFPSHLKQYLTSPVDYVRQSRGKVDVVVVGTIVMHSLSGARKALIVQRSRHDYMGSLWEVPGGSCDHDDSSILEAAARELHEEAGLHISDMLDVVEDDHEWFDHDKTWRKMTFLVEALMPDTAPNMVYNSSTASIPAQAYNNIAKKHTTTIVNTHELFVNGPINKKRALLDFPSPSSPCCDMVDDTTARDKDLPQVKLDPNEHEDFVWASEDEVRSDFCEGRTLDWTTPEQKAAILRAFDMMKSRSEKHEAR